MDKETYYKVAASWEEDVIHKAVVSKNRAYVFAALCLGLAIVAVYAVAEMAPLKRVEPVVIAYNEKTGVVRAVHTADDVEKVTQDEAVVKSIIAQYVIARETWDRSDENRRRKTVALLLSPKLLGDYSEEFNPMNARSAMKKFGDKITRRVEVSSVNFLNAKTAHVRFVTTDDDGVGDDSVVTYWAAVVAFVFTKKPQDEQDLFINPLGFQVTHYRRDQEVGPVKDASAALSAR